MKDVAYDWIMWKGGRGEDAAPMSWQVFQDAFLDRFFPREMRKAKVEEFMNLRQDSMMVKEYCLRFTQLSMYAPELVVNPRSNMSKFVTEVSDLVVKKCRTAMLIVGYC